MEHPQVLRVRLKASKTSVQYKELKLGGHSGHAKTNLSGHCVKMSGHYFKVTPILKYMIYMYRLHTEGEVAQ